ncbi:jg17214 [Pararge aegeria aegeria]|uniref:Jg17214 protein n=1 Tax=Pararge aegeria aegeria TaxID=348720 RepID=A0A8S4SJI5_9NEOP|nr:jg17214 [Pararge aegeria aegeria]
MADASKTQKDKIFYECCSRHAMASELLKCAECKKKYHFACVKTSNCQNYKDLTPEFLSSWQCPACNRPRPGIGNTNTPIRIPSSLFIASDSLDDLNRNVTNRNKRKKSRLSDSDTITPYDLTLEDVRQVVREELKALLDLFKSNIMSQVSPKLKEISDQITQVTNSISFMEQQHEELKKEVQLKIKSISVLETENKILQTTMKDLNARLSQLEQHSRESSPPNDYQVKSVSNKKRSQTNQFKALMSALSANIKNKLWYILCMHVKHTCRERNVMSDFLSVNRSVEE